MARFAVGSADREFLDDARADGVGHLSENFVFVGDARFSEVNLYKEQAHSDHSRLDQQDRQEMTETPFDAYFHYMVRAKSR